MAIRVDVNALMAYGLRTRTMHVPSMVTILHGWPQSWPHGSRNKHYDRLLAVVDEILDRIIPDPKRRDKFKDGNFALFCSMWYPQADWKDLLTVALFTVWAFVWDDTIDTNEDVLSDNFEKACAYREDSLAYVQWCLGVDDFPREEPPCPSAACGLFKDFADRYIVRFGKGGRKCEMFAYEVKKFFEHSEMEQAERLAGNLPSYAEYMHIRLGVTAVNIFVLLLEVVHHIDIPEEVMNMEEMNMVLLACNHIIIIINDILSLKKELATNCVINAVPILFYGGKTLDETIDFLMIDLERSRKRLDDAAALLDKKTRHNPKLSQNVCKFVDGLRLMDTATLEYTAFVKRYDVLEYSKPDGTFDIVL